MRADNANNFINSLKTLPEIFFMDSYAKKCAYLLSSVILAFRIISAFLRQFNFNQF